MKIVIAAGGTGGHVFPAQALAAELLARGHTCFWIGRPESLEARSAHQCGIPFHPVRMSGLRRRRVDKQLYALWQSLTASCRLALWLHRLAKREPTLVVTFGGYTSVAAGIAAWCTHLPLVIHEQNSFAGSANRLLARWADAVCCGFDTVFQNHPRRHYLGNPIRGQPQPCYRKDKCPLRILVLGGSLGAASLNRAITTLLAEHRLEQPLHLVHQCGETTHAETRTAYGDMELPLFRLRLRAFLKRVDWYYSWCDMIICRAGAITLAEVCASGKPALLVPFPHATDDHQYHNACALVEAGGAQVIRDDGNLVAQLAQTLLPMLNQPAAKIRPELQRLGQQLTRLAKPQAAGRMASLIEGFG